MSSTGEGCSPHLPPSCNPLHPPTFPISPGPAHTVWPILAGRSEEQAPVRVSAQMHKDQGLEVCAVQFISCALTYCPQPQSHRQLGWNKDPRLRSQHPAAGEIPCPQAEYKPLATGRQGTHGHSGVVLPLSSSPWLQKLLSIGNPEIAH